MHAIPSVGTRSTFPLVFVSLTLAAAVDPQLPVRDLSDTPRRDAAGAEPHHEAEQVVRPPRDVGRQFTLWAVRAAVLLWSVALSLRAAGRGEPIARRAWAIGCAALVIHIVGALAFFHGGSWDHAYDATAHQTEAVFGLRWGGGLYVNFIFAGVWTFDAVWRIARPISYSSRSNACEAAIQGFLWFIVFNGAVVFAAGAMRWFGAVACAVPVVIAIIRRRSCAP